MYTVKDRKTGEVLELDNEDRVIVLSPCGSLVEFFTDCGELDSRVVDDEFELLWY